MKTIRIEINLATKKHKTNPISFCAFCAFLWLILLIRGGTGFRSPGRRSDSLRRNLRLQEQQQIIAAAGLRVCTRHVEAAKRMHANQRARALAIEVQIADVKLPACALELRFIAAVNRARQAKLRVVRDLQRVVVILRFDYREHWSKDLLLLDRRTRFHVCNHGRFDEKSLLAV